MVSTWMLSEMWASRSRYGREKAASRLGISLEGVISTTNHLESLNGSLKRKYVPQWQHSGHRLRFDMLLYHLTSNILPQIYAQHRMIAQYSARKISPFGDLTSACTVVASGSKSRFDPGTSYVEYPYAWYSKDDRRDADAYAIFASKKLEPVHSARTYELWARCISMSELTASYWRTTHPTCSATCTYLDWLRRGHACKHMRAFGLLIEEWMHSGYLVPGYFRFPVTLEEAKAVEARNRAWYGDHYDREVASPSAGNTECKSSIAHV